MIVVDEVTARVAGEGVEEQETGHNATCIGVCC